MPENRIIYHDYNICTVCGGDNELGKTYYGEGYLEECETICRKCGFKNYWAYGWYQCDGNEM